MGFLRWLQKLLGMAAFSLIIVSLTLATSWFAVQFAFDRWVQQTDSYLPDFLNLNKPEAQNIAAMSLASPEAIAAQTPGTSSQTTIQPTSTDPTHTPMPSHESKSNQNSKQTNLPNERKEVVMDAEQFSSAKNGLTNQEKLRIYELFMKRVPETKLKEVANMLEGGISEKEIEQLRAILKAYFPKAEQEELEALGERWAPLPTSEAKKKSNESHE